MFGWRWTSRPRATTGSRRRKRDRRGRSRQRRDTRHIRAGDDRRGTRHSEGAATDADTDRSDGQSIVRRIRIPDDPTVLSPPHERHHPVRACRVDRRPRGGHDGGSTSRSRSAPRTGSLSCCGAGSGPGALTARCSPAAGTDTGRPDGLALPVHFSLAGPPSTLLPRRPRCCDVVDELRDKSPPEDPRTGSATDPPHARMGRLPSHRRRDRFGSGDDDLRECVDDRTQGDGRLGHSAIIRSFVEHRTDVDGPDSRHDLTRATRGPSARARCPDRAERRTPGRDTHA